MRGFWDGHSISLTICEQSTSFQTDKHIDTSSHNFYRPALFLTPNQQFQSTEGIVVMILIVNFCWFYDIYISPGSVATCTRCCGAIS